MPDIYLSYATGDEAAAIVVHAFLQASGWDCWRVPPHTTVPPETQWAALRGSQVYVLLWSALAANSAAVLVEWEYVMNRQRPLLVVLLDDTPLPKRLSRSTIIGHLPGDSVVSRLVHVIRHHMQNTPPDPFLTRIDAAFVDFVCWFFEAIQWRYEPDNTLFPLLIAGLPDLPDATYRVKFVRRAPEDIQDLYSVLCQPYPLLLFDFEDRAYDEHQFFQSEVWLYNYEWHAYTWYYNGTWHLIAQPDDDSRYGA